MVIKNTNKQTKPLEPMSTPPSSREPQGTPTSQIVAHLSRALQGFGGMTVTSDHESEIIVAHDEISEPFQIQIVPRSYQSSPALLQYRPQRAASHQRAYDTFPGLPPVLSRIPSPRSGDELAFRALSLTSQSEEALAVTADMSSSPQQVQGAPVREEAPRRSKRRRGAVRRLTYD